jgi:hypothetical protein
MAYGWVRTDVVRRSAWSGSLSTEKASTQESRLDLSPVIDHALADKLGP